MVMVVIVVRSRARARAQRDRCQRIHVADVNLNYRRGHVNRETCVVNIGSRLSRTRIITIIESLSHSQAVV